MLIIGTDIETTGLEPGDHRIVEFYGSCYDWDGVGTPALKDELHLRIHPQRSMPVEAQRIHNISLADLEGCPIWDAVGSQVYRFLASGDLIIAHNGKFFDGPFINHELARIGLPQVNVPIVDTMLEGRWATPQGKVPNLGELCFACDVPYDATPGKAHAADYDVGVMMECFFRAVRWGWFKLPSPAEEAA